MAALRGAENAAGPPDFQIAHGDTKTSAERTVLFDCVDSFARGADGHHFAGQQQIGVGFVLGTTNPAAELVKIGQTEAIGAVDDDRVGIGNIETALDDRRADKHVDFSSDEAGHYFLELV